jgi:hypothetical protein
MLLVFLLGLVVAFGCGDIPGDAENTGSILNVELITGVDNGEDQNTVDVVPGACEATEDAQAKPEPFFDHLARAEITNRPLPNTTQQTATTVKIQYYTVTYEPIDNTINGPLPGLLSYVDIPVQDSRGITPCQPGTSACAATEYILQKFFDVEKKQEYLERVCGASFHPSWPDDIDTPPVVPYPERCTWAWIPLGGYWYPSSLAEGEYNVRYTFHGENYFGVEFTFSDATVALVTDYNNCD